MTSGNSLNRAHVTWLEHKLVDLAIAASRCHLDNGNRPREPGLSESEKADTQGFLREILRVLPLLGVRVFEKPEAVAVPEARTGEEMQRAGDDSREKNTVVAPAKEDGFRQAFLGEVE